MPWVTETQLHRSPSLGQTRGSRMSLLSLRACFGGRHPQTHASQPLPRGPARRRPPTPSSRCNGASDPGAGLAGEPQASADIPLPPTGWPCRIPLEKGPLPSYSGQISPPSEGLEPQRGGPSAPSPLPAVPRTTAPLWGFRPGPGPLPHPVGGGARPPDALSTVLRPLHPQTNILLFHTELQTPRLPLA